MGIRSRDSVPVSRALQSALIFLAVAALAAFAAKEALLIPTRHVDGAFQTASGLYRLAHGDLPGRDFLPYLGLGPLYLLFPLFWISGAHLAASTFTAYFIAAVTLPVQFAVICYLTGRRNWFGAAAFACVITLAVLQFRSSLPLVDYALFFPGNSLRPLRALIPFVVVLAAEQVLRRIEAPVWRYAALGALGGAAVHWTNDFGGPAAMLLAPLTLALATVERRCTWKIAAAFVIAAVGATTLILFLATGGHPLRLLTYNLRDVSSDQWWYFGPYPGLRAFALSDVNTLLSADALTWPSIAVLTASWAVAIIKRERRSLLLCYLLSCLFLGGLIPTVAGQYNKYFGQFEVWSVATAILVTSSLVWRALGHRLAFLTVISRTIFLPLALILGAAVAVGQAGEYVVTRARLADDPAYTFAPELGGYLGADWNDYIAAARASRTRTLEEYWGLWSALTHVPAKPPTDAVIHALGEVRREFRSTLQAPSTGQVITTARSLTGWQAWSFSQNWWFYGQVLKSFVPVGRSPNTVLWKRIESIEWPDTRCSVAESNVTVEARQAGLYEVELEYRVDPPGGRSLAFVFNGLDVWGAPSVVSINPHGERASFPVAIRGDGYARFLTRLVAPAAPKRFLHLLSCNARRVPTDHIDPQYLELVLDPRAIERPHP
jgi:hypothetical protein